MEKPKRTPRKTAASTEKPAAPKIAKPPAKRAPARRPRKAEQVHPTQEQIRLRAFQIFLHRGGAPGDAHHDWIQAERELYEEMNAPRDD